MNTKKYFLLIAAILLYSFAFSKSTSADTITAATIISKTKMKYAGLINYFDSGKVITRFYDFADKRPAYNSAKYFRTAFSIKGLFNFEFYNLNTSNSLFIINRNAMHVVNQWWGANNKTSTFSTLEKALGAAAGISSTVSTFIPGLLSYELKKQTTLQKVTNPVLKGTETINGSLCYKIIENSNGRNVELWIDKNSFMIIKMKTDGKVTDFKVQNTFFFYPYQPKQVRDDLFLFRPNREVEL